MNDRLQALQARGAARLLPVRWQLLQSLARRAAMHQGAARRVLDEKLARQLAACEDELETRLAAETGATPKPMPSPFKALMAGMTEPAQMALPANAPTSARTAPGELKAMQLFKRTWSRLSAEQRLAQSLASLPDNAGPLNSQHLVHRSLHLMRELSPAYLEHFIAHADALLWLDRVNISNGR
ncbi:DUF2894 domain-containing protein [Ideonella azotifigens]|uniref:DUF2894 domain-containing protein n=1 Tax=Ideonella azotifigens TaxID=513160 RepID=A0ABP3VW37_9BURK|nr:DUF2894 domain-containing protein [Ideonella azotifigens]MCD2339185.1 DUF2894 domain-containing protein [Ideonella azotifigens]